MKVQGSSQSLYQWVDRKENLLSSQRTSLFGQFFTWLGIQLSGLKHRLCGRATIVEMNSDASFQRYCPQDSIKMPKRTELNTVSVQVKVTPISDSMPVLKAADSHLFNTTVAKVYKSGRLVTGHGRLFEAKWRWEIHSWKKGDKILCYSDMMRDKGWVKCYHVRSGKVNYLTSIGDFRKPELSGNYT